jgi:hypothetical protein
VLHDSKSVLCAQFYEGLAKRVSNNGHAVDLFAGCLDQVGLLEMKALDQWRYRAVRFIFDIHLQAECSAVPSTLSWTTRSCLGLRSQVETSRRAIRSAARSVRIRPRAYDTHEPPSGRGGCAYPYERVQQTVGSCDLSQSHESVEHPFPLRAFVLRDGVPVSEDDKRVNVILRHPSRLADLEQGQELKVNGQQTVRWCKVVDGKGGKKEGLFEWVCESVLLRR